MRSTRIGKKAQVEEHLIHFAIVFDTIYKIVALSIAVTIFVSTVVNTDETELKILASRLIHESSEYDKDTGRTYTGMIDSSALNEEKMNKAMNFEKERTLGAKAVADGVEIKYNDKWFERLKTRTGYDVAKVQTHAYLDYDGQGKSTLIEAVT